MTSETPSFASWRSYWDFRREVSSHRRFTLFDESQAFLAALARTSVGSGQRIAAGTMLCRAQVAHQDRENSHAGTIPGAALPKRMSIGGVEPLALMHRLRDVASFSASSACATDKVETSHVLLAMFGDTSRARQAFRVSPGRFKTVAEMTTFTDALIETIGELRRIAT